MDGEGTRLYVVTAMNLLLLFSAILSALTGAGIGVRRPEVMQTVSAQMAEAEPSCIAAAKRAWRPIAVLPKLTVSSAFDMSAAPFTIGAVDLWTNRRRE